MALSPFKALFIQGFSQLFAHWVGNKYHVPCSIPTTMQGKKRLGQLKVPCSLETRHQENQSTKFPDLLEEIKNKVQVSQIAFEHNYTLQNPWEPFYYLFIFRKNRYDTWIMKPVTAVSAQIINTTTVQGVCSHIAITLPAWGYWKRTVTGNGYRLCFFLSKLLRNRDVPNILQAVLEIQFKPHIANWHAPHSSINSFCALKWDLLNCKTLQRMWFNWFSLPALLSRSSSV